MARLYDGAKAPRTEGVALAIVNPVAGRGRAARLWPEVEPILRAAFPGLGVHRTSAPGEAEAVALEWGAKHSDGHLLVAGGDGTVHEVVNGIWTSGSRATLGILPLGSGNDFARNVGLALNPGESARALGQTPPRNVDLGVLSFDAGQRPGRRVFLNSASLGVSVRANRIAKWLASLGLRRARYSCAGLAAVLSAKSAFYRIRVEGESWFDGRALNLTVANGPGFGGGIRISPNSSPRDGILELVRLGTMGTIRALKAFAKLQHGAHLALPEVTTTSLRSATLAGSERLALEADGEELEVEGEIKVTIEPARLSLLG